MSYLLAKSISRKKRKDTIENFLKIQDGRCAICRRLLKDCFDLDHDHREKKIRGLLCYHCNRHVVPSLEKICEAGHLRLAINYVFQFRRQTSQNFLFNHMLGKKHTPESRFKMALAHRGKKLSSTHKRKIQIGVNRYLSKK